MINFVILSDSEGSIIKADGSEQASNPALGTPRG